MIKVIKAWLKGLVFGMHISTKMSVSTFLYLPYETVYAVKYCTSLQRSEPRCCNISLGVGS
jgi:hypothetical protein